MKSYGLGGALVGRTVTVTELLRNFAVFIGRVAYGGESFLLKRGKEVVAELRPAAGGRQVDELPHLLGSLPRLDPEEARAMALELTRGTRGPSVLEDPWAS